VANVQLAAAVREAYAPGESKTVSFTVPAAWLQVVTEEGKRIWEAGAMTLFAGSSQPDCVSTSLLGRKPLEGKFIIK